MIPSWARKGAKVVCIATDWTCDREDEDLPNPVFGHEYQLDAAEEDDDMVSGVGCYLVGFGDEAFYDLAHFAPAVSDTTEMALYYKNGLHQSVSRKKSVDA